MILNITEDAEVTIRYLCGSSTAHGLECYVFSWIQKLYNQTLLQKGLDVYAIAVTVAQKLAVDLRTVLGSKTISSHKVSSSLTQDLRDRLLLAFTKLDYHGVAVNEFRSYLNDCLK